MKDDLPEEGRAGGRLDPAMLEALRRAAERERTRASHEVDEAISGIEARAASEIEAEAAAIRSEARVRLGLEKSRLLSEAAAEARAELLRARRSAIERVYEGARQALAETDGSPRYRAAIVRLAKEAAEALVARTKTVDGGVAAQGPCGAVAVAARDRGLASEAIERAGLAGRVGLAAEEACAGLPPGSALARSADGRVEIDNGIAARLERARGRLEARIAAILGTDEAT